MDRDGSRFFDAADQHHFAGRDAEGAFHFLVAVVADEDHGAALGGVALDFEMDLGHQRAGGIDNAQVAILGAIPFAGRDAMGAENDALAVGHLVEALDENRALLFQRLQHEAVVHDLMAHIKRAPVRAQGAADGLDRAIDARAKPARLSQDDFLNHSFAQCHPRFVMELSARSIRPRDDVRLLPRPYFTGKDVVAFRPVGKGSATQAKSPIEIRV